MFFLRIIFAAIWTVLLTFFAYTKLFIDAFVDQDVSVFAEKLIGYFQNENMIFPSMGLVAMLYFDNIITKKFTGDNKGEHSQTIVGIIILSFLCIGLLGFLTKYYESIPWLSISIFLIFIFCLIAYKTNTLTTKYNSSPITNL